MRYTKTVTIQNEMQLMRLRIGQWFKYGLLGNKGQFLGKDKAGKPIVRMGKFCKGNAIRNKLLRAIAV